MSTVHRTLGPGQIHPLHDFTFATQAARLASALAPSDVGKVAFQQSDQTFWVLASASPMTWKPVSGTKILAIGSFNSNGSINFIQGATIEHPATGQYRIVFTEGVVAPSGYVLNATINDGTVGLANASNKNTGGFPLLLSYIAATGAGFDAGFDFVAIDVRP